MSSSNGDPPDVHQDLPGANQNRFSELAQLVNSMEAVHKSFPERFVGITAWEKQPITII